MDDILLMMQLSRSYDIYLTKSSRADLFRYAEINHEEVRKLDWDCWVMQRDAFRVLAKIYDSNGSEEFLQEWAPRFGWTFEQLGKKSLRDWLSKGEQAEDHGYGNPVDGHIIFLKMASNFPPEAIEWVKRATWEGPVDIAWDNIDTDGLKTWAAFKQPERVKEFEQKIRMHHGDIEPTIMIKDNDTPKSIIIDGHHRALARHNMNMPVLSYVGRINPADRKAAEETHSKQIHSGADPRNKNIP